jgi:hypothetical protein
MTDDVDASGGQATTDTPATPDAQLEPGASPARDPKASPIEHHRTVRNAAMLTAGMGIAFALLYYLAAALTSSVPGARATDQELVDFYNSGSTAIPVIVGLYVSPFAGIAFIWFIVSLRMWSAATARRNASALQSNLQLVAGIAFVVITFVSAAASSVLAVAVQLGSATADPIVARQFPIFGQTLNVFFGMRMAAMFVFTSSALARTSGILPRWFIFLGFVVGLFLLLTAVLSQYLQLVFPTWVLLLCLLLLREVRRIPSDLQLPAPAPVGYGRPIELPIGNPRDSAQGPATTGGADTTTR